MALSVAVNLSAYPEGIPVGIVGIGAGENGGTIEVDPAMESVFYSINGDTIENVLADQEEMNVSGSSEFTPEEPPVAPEQQPEVPPEAPQTEEENPQLRPEGGEA